MYHTYVCIIRMYVILCMYMIGVPHAHCGRRNHGDGCQHTPGMLPVQWLQVCVCVFVPGRLKTRSWLPACCQLACFTCHGCRHTYTHSRCTHITHTHKHTHALTHVHTHTRTCTRARTHTHTHTCSVSMMGKSFVSIDGKVLCDPCASKEAVGGSASSAASCAACGTIYIIYRWYIIRIMLPLVLPVVLYML